MVSVKEVEADKLILAVANKLKQEKELKPPIYVSFVKTGVSKERPPQREDWWWIRTASVLRKIYLYRNTGVNRLRNIYGSRKSRGHKPEHKYKASGAIIRNILQQLERIGFLKTEKGKGRIVTQKGKVFLDEVAKSIK